MWGGVLRVQHLADVLGERLRTDGLQVVAVVEHLEVEGLGGSGAPQAQGVHVAGPVPGNHVVVRDPVDFPTVHPAGAGLAVLVLVQLGVPGEADLHPHFRMREFPRRSVLQPGVRLLHLIAVDKSLPENAVLVTDPVADGRNSQGGQGIDVAGREPAETAVAQTRFDLDGADAVQVDAQRTHRLLGSLGEA